jgi:hypothetical protein
MRQIDTNQWKMLVFLPFNNILLPFLFAPAPRPASYTSHATKSKPGQTKAEYGTLPAYAQQLKKPLEFGFNPV